MSLVRIWLLHLLVLQKKTLVITAEECGGIHLFFCLGLGVQEEVFVVVVGKHGLPLRIQILPGFLRLWLVLRALRLLGRLGCISLGLVLPLLLLLLLLLFLLLSHLFERDEVRTRRSHVQRLQHVHGRLPLHRARLEVVLLGICAGADFAEEVILFLGRVVAKEVVVGPLVRAPLLRIVLPRGRDERQAFLEAGVRRLLRRPAVVPADIVA